MNKILFTLLVSGISFAGIQDASAVRAMHAENSQRRITHIQKAKIHKPAPHAQEQQIAQDAAKKWKALIKYAEEELKDTEGEAKKENAPVERIKGSRKFQISNGGQISLLNSKNEGRPSLMTKKGRALHEAVVQAIPLHIISIVTAQPIYHRTRRVTLSSK